MDLELREVVAFRTQNEASIQKQHRAARDELGFELPLPLFALRVYEASEILFGARPPSPARIAQFIAELHVVDLYLAAAVAEDLPAARQCLERWHGPQLAALARLHGRTDLAAPGPSSPLARFAGMCPLRIWLAMSAAAGRSAPRARQRAPQLTSSAPEIRSAIDLEPARAVASLEREERLALALALVGRVDMARAADVAGRSTRSFTTSCDRLARDTVAAIDEALHAANLGRRARAQLWGELGQGLGMRKPRRTAVALRLLRDACVRALSDDPTEHPDPNLLLATLDRFDGVDRVGIQEHALTCWACLDLLAAGASGAGATGLPRPASVRSGPRWAAAILVSALLATGAIYLRPQLAGLMARLDAPEPPPSLPAQSTPAIPARERATPTPRSTPARPAATTTTAERPAMLLTRPSLVVEPSEADPTDSPQSQRESVAEGRTRRDGRADGEPSPTAASITADLPSPDATSRTPTDEPRSEESSPVAPPPAPPAVPEDLPADDSPLPSLQRANGRSPAARLVNLAVAREGSGDRRSALDVLARALRLEPDLPEAHWNAAILLERAGAADDAADHWASFLALRPSGDQAEQARRRLR